MTSGVPDLPKQPAGISATRNRQYFKQSQHKWSPEWQARFYLRALYLLSVSRCLPPCPLACLSTTPPLCLYSHIFLVVFTECLCRYAFAHVCAWVLHISALAQRLGEDIGCPALSFLLLRQSLTEPEAYEVFHIGCLDEFWSLPASAPWYWSCRHAHILYGCWTFELRSSRCKQQILTNWTISPVFVATF